MSIKERIHRKFPFQGLEDYLSSQEIPVFDNTVNYKSEGIQLNFISDPSRKLRTKVAYLYEYLAKSIYGNLPKKIHTIKHATLEKYFEFEIDIETDDSAIEIKASRIGKGDLKLEDIKMAKRCLIYNNEFVFNKNIIYTLFSHKIGRLRDFSEEKELIQSLCSNTFSMIQFPFRVAFDLWISKKSGRVDGDYTKKYICSRIYSHFWNSLLLYPEETLKYHDVDIEGLEFIKGKMSNNIIFNGFNLSQFPVLIIKNNKSKEWEDKFYYLMNNKDKLPDFFKNSFDNVFTYEVTPSDKIEENEGTVQQPLEETSFDLLPTPEEDIRF